MAHMTALRVLPILLIALFMAACEPRQYPAPPFPVADPGVAEIDEQALQSLLARARESRSDALVIVKDGNLLVEYYRDTAADGRPGDPIEAMSITKSILGLAIGRLLADGLITSIDLPVGEYFPEWEHGARVSIRQLLQHTSGICGDPITEAIYRSEDFVAHALSAGLCSTPGETFFYNNNATNLLAGLVQRASGKPLDDYLHDTLFAEMGIERFSWTRDRSGNPHGMSGLQIHAMDLARIGQLMLDGGRWQGRQLVPQDWVGASIQPGPIDPWSGMLWWLVPAWDVRRFDDALFERWRAAGVDQAFIERLLPLSGRSIARVELARVMAGLLGENWRQQTRTELGARGLSIGVSDRGPAVGFEANGYLGQYLLVIPEARLIAVRQIRHGNHSSDDHSFEEFRFMVLELIAPSSTLDIPVRPEETLP